MLRSAILTRRVAKGTAQVIGGSLAVSVGAVACYASTDHGQRLRREITFWTGVLPVVTDYYWHFGKSSPYTAWKRFTNVHENLTDQERKQARQREMQELHEKHALPLLNVLISLKGLYVKLGQVLSVTTLPVPESYRDKFRTLQSDVPGWQEFEESVEPVLKRELGRPIEEVFESIDPVPCGAASIGQAHKAVLKSGEQVIVKVQYPDAAWQVPADIHSVGQFLQLCVFFGVVDEDAANLSFNEFSRQFIAELDYDQESRNLREIYQSSLDPESPYHRRGVVVPHVYPRLCTSKVITMSYLPGPKLEEEARRQLQALGIDTKKGIGHLDRTTTSQADSSITGDYGLGDELELKTQNGPTGSWQQFAAQSLSKAFSVNTLLSAARLVQRVQLWCTSWTVKSVQLLSSIPMLGSWAIPPGIQEWAEGHSCASKQSQRLALTKEWIDALFDVHGHQIFNLGCFNADCHPGNILVVEDETGSDRPQLGLIDFGQCKRLSPQEQAQIAKLVVSVSNNEPDEAIASAFREMGIRTRNDSTEFLANFAKLLFGPLESYHFSHRWHKKLHQQDSVKYFPQQLSMVYRTAMLLRGLAMSLQFNVSVGDLWKDHAQEALDRMETVSLTKKMTLTEPSPHPFPSAKVVLSRATTANHLGQKWRENTVETN
mmetsp:Transcript_15201/g.33267  ORF Transcript_15201/g.33267 Transcript_15201/m.33267 type:complete len:659 (-) Transcript_15201:73-2049(-)